MDFSNEAVEAMFRQHFPDFSPEQIGFDSKQSLFWARRRGFNRLVNGMVQPDDLRFLIIDADGSIVALGDGVERLEDAITDEDRRRKLADRSWWTTP